LDLKPVPIDAPTRRGDVGSGALRSTTSSEDWNDRAELRA